MHACTFYYSDIYVTYMYARLSVSMSGSLGTMVCVVTPSVNCELDPQQ